MGTYAGPGKNGQVVKITASQPVEPTGKYVVIQLKEKSQILNLNEVKVICSAGSGKVLVLFVSSQTERAYTNVKCF